MRTLRVSHRIFFFADYGEVNSSAQDGYTHHPFTSTLVYTKPPSANL